MAENKNEEMKATVIKKAPVAQEKTEIKDEPVKRKIVIKKKPVVKIKMKDEAPQSGASEPEIQQEKAQSEEKISSVVQEKPEVAKPSQVKEESSSQKAKEEKKNYGTVIGQNRFTSHASEPKNPSTRISSPLHHGPVTGSEQPSIGILKTVIWMQIAWGFTVFVIRLLLC